MESILNSTKKVLGLTEDYTFFDQDIILHINSVFSILQEMGVGPEDGFRITDASTNWEDYIGDNKVLNMVKTYMGLKVGVLFDPPLSSVVMEAKNRMISEMEWRLNAAVDPQDNVMNPPVDPLDNADPNAEFEDQEDLNEDDLNELFGN